MTVDQIIAKAGGVTKLAELMGVNHSTVCGWKRDGLVPAARAVLIHQRLDLPLDDIPWRRPAETAA